MARVLEVPTGVIDALADLPIRWLEDEGEIARSPMERMRPPKVVEQPVPVLSTDELRSLLRACEGRSFAARRDTAIVSVFLDTGARLAELLEQTPTP